jgi:hypothetical protein
MSVELLGQSTTIKGNPDLLATLIFSLLGLTVTLFVLPLLGADYGQWLAMAN